MPARTVSRVLRRAGVPYLWQCDPLTGDGGGWRANGRAAGSTARRRHTRIGFDYVHSAVDDHSRVAYSEILTDEKGPTCTAFIDRALTYFAALNAPVRAIITDNHWSYSHSRDLRTLLTARGTEHWFIKPHCPWQNGKVERFNRTLATEWAYHQVYRTNDDRTQAFTTWLKHYKHWPTPQRRRHRPDHPPVTNVTAKDADRAPWEIQDLLGPALHDEARPTCTSRHAPRRSPSGSATTTCVSLNSHPVQLGAAGALAAQHGDVAVPKQ